MKLGGAWKRGMASVWPGWYLRHQAWEDTSLPQTLSLFLLKDKMAHGKCCTTAILRCAK